MPVSESTSEATQSVDGPDSLTPDPDWQELSPHDVVTELRTCRETGLSTVEVVRRQYFTAATPSRSQIDRPG